MSRLLSTNNTELPKKIVYLIGTLRVGGAERRLTEVVLRLNQERFTPHVYCLSGSGPLESALLLQGINITIPNLNTQGNSRAKSIIPMGRLNTFLALYRFLRIEQPDIVHCFMYTPSLYGGLAAKLAGVPVILISRGSLGYDKDTHPSYRLLETVVNHLANKVIVNSQAVREVTLEQECIAAEKIQVIYGGVDVDKFRPLWDNSLIMPRWQKKAQLGIPNEAPVIGVIANLIPYKGHRELLLAMRRVHAVHSDAYLLCIGEDRGIQQHLEYEAQRLGIAGHVIFAGLCHNIVEWINLFDIQASASHHEGFSNALLEGMASGKPVVATAVGGTREAVIEGVTGLLVPPHDPDALSEAIIHLLNNPKFALQLGQNGRKRVEQHFSSEQMVRRLENLYCTLLRDR